MQRLVVSPVSAAVLLAKLHRATASPSVGASHASLPAPRVNSRKNSPLPNTDTAPEDEGNSWDTPVNSAHIHTAHRTAHSQSGWLKRWGVRVAASNPVRPHKEVITVWHKQLLQHRGEKVVNAAEEKSIHAGCLNPALRYPTSWPS